MLQLILETNYQYGKRTATVFRFDRGIKIIGFKNGDHFDLRVLTIGFNPKRSGLGQEALRLLRPKFKRISVNEIYEETLPFWIKMKERGLADDLGPVKEGEKNWAC
ncbi:hypothetical protein PTH_1962 [Pelotomaculum thermopropionicum SI]|uniref:Uncharacterized protein n=1 Tax=Pelotomaculum thermopropionicum (strain DSM 13744 / JCM 10971 / SI) TaxID=370438 RepID=A5D0V3_PELTS|nr:hypothetical protein PTH_1962 [Pelotomaculum thermopropionicum SI]